MRVISRRPLREFCSEHPDAESPLVAWYKVAKNATWKTPAEMKSLYPSADLVNELTVFNIGGNKYRLIVKINYKSQRIFVKAVMTHKQYDLGKWKQ